MAQTPLLPGTSFIITQVSGNGKTATPFYPKTKIENVLDSTGKNPNELFAVKDHGTHVPSPEQSNPLKFLNNDNTWKEIQHASSSVFGVVKLTDSTTLDDGTLAASAKAVKAAYDKANHEHPYITTDKMGTANGVATLDSDGHVPAAQLPSFVDDILEGTYKDPTNFLKPSEEGEGEPYTPEAGKIYIDTKTNKSYRWTGSAYVVIPETIALGTTSSTAFRGDWGKEAYDHSKAPHAKADATKVEKSDQNGYVKIDGSETLVYAHPGTGTNPHGTTKEDVGLGKVENMTAAEIINTLSKQKIEEILGGSLTIDVATESKNGLMSSDHVKKLNACMAIYIQPDQPSSDGLWFHTEA